MGKQEEYKEAPMPPPPCSSSSAVPSAAAPVPPNTGGDTIATADGDGSQGVGTPSAATGSGSGSGGGAKEAGQEEQEEEGEERRERRADVDRHLANLYISVLEARHKESVAPLGGFDPIGKVPPRVAAATAASARSGKGREGEEERREREEEEEKLGFVSLGLGDLPLCDPFMVGGDFESVREVFKLARVCGISVLFCFHGWDGNCLAVRF